METFKAAVEKKFADYNLKMSIGGQIIFDIFPVVKIKFLRSFKILELR